MQPFVHLHSHTEFSLLDGISRLPDMVRRAKELNQPALPLQITAICTQPFIFIRNVWPKALNRLLVVKYM